MSRHPGVSAPGQSTDQRETIHPGYPSVRWELAEDLINRVGPHMYLVASIQEAEPGVEIGQIQLRVGLFEPRGLPRHVLEMALSVQLPDAGDAGAAERAGSVVDHQAPGGLSVHGSSTPGSGITRPIAAHGGILQRDGRAFDRQLSHRAQRATARRSSPGNPSLWRMPW